MITQLGCSSQPNGTAWTGEGWPKIPDEPARSLLKFFLAHDEHLLLHEARGECRCFATTREVRHGSTKKAHRGHFSEPITIQGIDGRYCAGLPSLPMGAAPHVSWRRHPPDYSRSGSPASTHPGPALGARLRHLPWRALAPCAQAQLICGLLRQACARPWQAATVPI